MASASTALRDAIVSALGGSRTGEALVALLGLGAPASDPAWPHALDLVALAENPTRAIAAVHRDALGSAQHDWGDLFGELAAIFGVDGPVRRAGTPEDPWRVTLAEGGLVGLELAGWNAAGRDTPAGTELLGWVSAPRSNARRGPARGAPRSSRLICRRAALHAALRRFAIPLADAGARGPAAYTGGPRADCEWHFGAERVVGGNEPGVVGSTAGPDRHRKWDNVGPLTIDLSPASFDPTAPDLGLGNR